MAEFFLNFLLLGIEEIQQKMEWDNSKYVYLTHNVILNFTTLDSFICKIRQSVSFCPEKSAFLGKEKGEKLQGISL